LNVENKISNRFEILFKYLFLNLTIFVLSHSIILCQTKQIDKKVLKRSETIRKVFHSTMPPSLVPQTQYIDQSKLNILTKAKSQLQLQTILSNSTMYEPLPGPSGGGVSSIARDSAGWLFISTNGEVYRSSDNGAHWELHLFPSQLHNDVEPVTVLGPNVIAAETDFSDFISTDRGGTWNYFSDDVRGFAVDTNGEIYAGSNYGGMKKSTDTAKTWIQLGLNGTKIWKVVLCGNGKFACPSDSGTYYSSDTGKTWAYRAYETPFTWNLISDKRGHLFVLRYYGADFELYRSSDFGETWQHIILPLQEDVWRIYIEDDGRVFVTTDNHVLTSTDTGETWTQLSFSNGNPGSIGRDASGNLLVGSSNGIYRYHESNNSWEELNNGIHARRIERIQFTSAGSILVQSLWNWYRSTDGGASWTVLKFDSTVTSLSAYAPILSTSAGSIFIAAALDNECGFLRSTDDGVSWRKISVLSNYYFFYGLAESSTGDLYAVDGYNNIYTSSNNGDSWRSVAQGNGYAGSTSSAVATDKFGNCYIAKDSSVLILRNGAVYKEVPLKRNFAAWESMSVDARGEVFLGSSYNGVYSSSDTGNSWSLLNNGLFDTYVMSTAADDSGNVILGTSSGVFRLADSVGSWNWFSDGLPRSYTTSLAISAQGFLFVGFQDYGIYKSVAPLCRRVPQIENPPPPPPTGVISNFRIYQNYPNPFNDRTVIRYEVSTSAKVEIKIYNVLGQVVALLISTELPEGRYDAGWTPAQVASGVYFCEMKASSASRTYRETIKLLYLK
jgi:photosystem II stability/assembly factor-like uncharacterized protein